jgi:3,4-dihydroxy-2-butanone 4-phosphate synthase
MCCDALAGSYPAGVLCEIVDRSDGSMARTPLLMAFAQQHDLTLACLLRCYIPSWVCSLLLSR